MLASQQGALILNYGFKGKPVLASPPGIYLMDSPRAYPAGETFPSSYEGGQLFSLTSQYYWMGNTYQAGNYMWHGNSQTGDWLTGNYSGKYDTLFLFQKDEHTPAHLDLGNLNTHGPIHINNLPNSQSYSSYIQFVNPTDPYLAIELWNYRSIWGKNTSDIEIDTNHNGNYTPRLLIKGNAAQGNAGITSYEPITITVATGTAPITVSSTTVCSNLNADKLDGQDGSFYQNASNINSGTVPTARLGSGSPSSSTWLRGDGSWQTLSSIPWDGGIVNNNISIVRPMTEAVLYLEYSYANSIWALRSYTNGSFYMSRNGTDRLIVNTDGQLQIPTTGSGAGLLIGGDVQLYRSTDNTLTIPDFVNITPPSGNAQLLINANNAAPIITLQRNGSDRVTISHDGSSGKINCHSGNLDLAAATNYIMMPVNIQIGGKRLYEDNTWLRSAGNLQSNGYFAVAYLNGSGDADVYYDTDGGVLATQASSAKYKTNIETLNDAAWVYSLRPVAFDWKDTEKAAKKGRQLGLIAEEVAAVYPSLAVQAGGVDTIRYTGLIVPLLTCIQQLRREVTELREQLAEHKAEREVKAA